LSQIRSRWERTVPIADVYPLARVREAYTELGRRHTHGKIVLRP
jgi:NADPH:quinone reductase-like Zn-dependent oxidoreductase